MARATTKLELVASAEKNYTALLSFVERLLEQEPIQGSPALTVRDVLTHLYEWHEMLLNWVPANLAGNSKPFLPAPYNWGSYSQLNILLAEKHQKTTLEESLKLVQNSHLAVMNLMNDFTDQDLFVKKVFSWTGGSTLGSYFISVTASHYDWALKEIKKSIKNEAPKL